MATAKSHDLGFHTLNRRGNGGLAWTSATTEVPVPFQVAGVKKCLSWSNVSVALITISGPALGLHVPPRLSDVGGVYGLSCFQAYAKLQCLTTWGHADVGNQRSITLHPSSVCRRSYRNCDRKRTCEKCEILGMPCDRTREDQWWMPRQSSTCGAGWATWSCRESRPRYRWEQHAGIPQHGLLQKLWLRALRLSRSSSFGS